MSVNKYNSQTGELTTIASGQRTWIGTKEAYEQQKQAGTLPTDCLICITNDEDDTIADAVTENDPRAVTSGAVYDYVIPMAGTLGSLVYVQADNDPDTPTKNCNDIASGKAIYGGYAAFSNWTNIPFPEMSGTWAGAIYTFRGYFYYKWQIAVHYSGSYIAMRTQNGSNGTWNSWKMVYTAS